MRKARKALLRQNLKPEIKQKIERIINCNKTQFKLQVIHIYFIFNALASLRFKFMNNAGPLIIDM